MKRVYFICLFTSLVMVLAAFVIHASTKEEAKTIKVGFIFVGDEITPYTENFINAEKHVEDVFGDNVQCLIRYNVPEGQVEGPARELIAAGCDYIIAPSYGYGGTIKELAAEFPKVQFCVPTGDNANTDKVLSNYHNCFGRIYEGRYICGIVAGMKIREMIDEGIITPEQAVVGYVAAFPYAEVISGYTAFYLGVQSVVPEATMLVKYTDTWSSYTLEKKAAIDLIDAGCVVISQHSDTTGPAVACESSDREIPVYHVGYNQSMTEIAPTRSLVSCNVDFSYYFEQSIRAVLEDKKIESGVDARVVGQDCMAGFDKGWVRILDVNTAIVANGTQNVIDQKIEELKYGTLQVFQGEFTGTNPYDENDTINLKTAYTENAKMSSPSFNYILDEVISVIP